jgi:hypothetical protein
MTYEFSLPNVDLHIGDARTNNSRGGFSVDHINLDIGGRCWILRRMATLGGSIVPVDVVYGAGVFQIDYSDHCCLQAVGTEAERASLEETADSLCWLLQIALGQKVAWTVLRERSSKGATMIQSRSVAVESSPRPNAPLRNSPRGVLKNYLESAYPVYRSDEEWWRVTADWFVMARSSGYVQVAGLIASMLFDRCTSKILKSVKFPPQIDPKVANLIGTKGSKREDIAQQLDGIFSGDFPNWNNGRSNAILDVVVGWDASPSYFSKIMEAFKTIGMSAPSKELMASRHTLAHTGELKEGSLTIPQYHSAILGTLTEMLLRMLSYRGKFSVVGTGEQEIT